MQGLDLTQRRCLEQVAGSLIMLAGDADAGFVTAVGERLADGHIAVAAIGQGREERVGERRGSLKRVLDLAKEFAAESGQHSVAESEDLDLNVAGGPAERQAPLKFPGAEDFVDENLRVPG